MKQVSCSWSPSSQPAHPQMEHLGQLGSVTGLAPSQRCPDLLPQRLHLALVLGGGYVPLFEELLAEAAIDTTAIVSPTAVVPARVPAAGALLFAVAGIGPVRAVRAGLWRRVVVPVIAHFLSFSTRFRTIIC